MHTASYNTMSDARDDLDDVVEGIARLWIDEEKEYIVSRFIAEVQGKEPEVTSRHCGAEGHWLEEKMGLRRNRDNAPDIRGYEMKKLSKKITFGDFSASEYLFTTRTPLLERHNGAPIVMNRNDFITTFGEKNPRKHNRWSWSGNCVPRYGEWNHCGQRLVCEEGNILAQYNHHHDTRPRKSTFAPPLRERTVVIAIWTREKMQRHINAKFNVRGFFLCEKVHGVYRKLLFGNPFSYDDFLREFKNKKIIFDSGMYRGNSRNYSQFRASAQFWREMVVEEFE